MVRGKAAASLICRDPLALPNLQTGHTIELRETPKALITKSVLETA